VFRQPFQATQPLPGRRDLVRAIAGQRRIDENSDVPRPVPEQPWQVEAGITMRDPCDRQPLVVSARGRRAIEGNNRLRRDRSSNVGNHSRPTEPSQARGEWLSGDGTEQRARQNYDQAIDHRLTVPTRVQRVDIIRSAFGPARSPLYPRLEAVATSLLAAVEVSEPVEMVTAVNQPLPVRRGDILNLST
jgi:hypothetical protein